MVGLSDALMRTENTHRDWAATGSGDDEGKRSNWTIKKKPQSFPRAAVSLHRVKKKKRETSGMTAAAAAWFSSATFFFTQGMETRRTKCTDTISLVAQQEGKSDIQ